MEQYEQDEARHLNGISARRDSFNQTSLRKVVAVSPGGLPSCGSANVEVEEPQAQTIEAVTGVSQRKLGQMRAISVPYTQLRHEISCSAEESPWMRWKRRVRIEEVRANSLA